MKWLDKTPLILLLVLAVFMAFAPMTGASHLWEKSLLLAGGSLTKPLDIFDLFIHLTPTLLLIVKLLRYKAKNTEPSTSD